MATAKKPAAKKAPAKKAAPKKPVVITTAPRSPVMTRKVAKVPAGEKFAMPMEVKDWIDRANATINHLRNKVETLERENKELKQYRRFAEKRILNVSPE